jgi:hypothetical protein
MLRTFTRLLLIPFLFVLVLRVPAPAAVAPTDTLRIESTHAITLGPYATREAADAMAKNFGNRATIFTVGNGFFVRVVSEL